MRAEGISFSVMEDYPYGNVPEEWMKELTDVLQSNEDRTRKALAEGSLTSWVIADRGR
jgi:hypothetical protein